MAKVEFWKETINPEVIFAVSALLNHNVTGVMDYIKEKLPVHAPYYEKDELTDKSMRFFVSEMIREKYSNCMTKKFRTVLRSLSLLIKKNQRSHVLPQRSS